MLNREYSCVDERRDLTTVKVQNEDTLFRYSTEQLQFLHNTKNILNSPKTERTCKNRVLFVTSTVPVCRKVKESGSKTRQKNLRLLFFSAHHKGLDRSDSWKTTSVAARAWTNTRALVLAGLLLLATVPLARLASIDF